MRELTKSMMSYSWAMSLFGVQQMVNLLTPMSGSDPTGKTVQAFANVTDATTKVLDGSLKEAFKMGDSLQKDMLDFMFGGILAGGFDPNRWAQAGGDALQKITDIGRGMTQGTSQEGGSGSGRSGTAQPSSAGLGPTGSPGTGWGPMPH
jgi:hypothetical protein